MKPIKIIELGGEGGKITLFGWKPDHDKWHFLRETDEHTLQDMLCKDDLAGLSFQSSSETVIGWNAALKILSKYPWRYLCPLYVHPEFVDLVWKEFSKQGKEYYNRFEWEEACGRRS